MTLYRPVGLKELELIAASGWREFPPRLFWQPIFYPVLTHDYALKIATDWNTKDEASGYAGFVTKFDVENDYAAHFEVHEVGGQACKELWIPADELPEFNRRIVGRIELMEAVYGDSFGGDIDSMTNLPTGLMDQATL